MRSEPQTAKKTHAPALYGRCDPYGEGALFFIVVNFSEVV
jgi:hypothetical protein